MMPCSRTRKSHKSRVTGQAPSHTREGGASPPRSPRPPSPALSTRPAKLFGLFPRKGTIAVGSDADLVVFDSNYRGTISARTHHINNNYSGFEGFAVEGRPVVVTVRGKIQVRDGLFIGEKGRGQLLHREPIANGSST